MPLTICRVSNFYREKLVLRILEDIPTTSIELNVQSAGVTEYDQETEEQLWQKKKEARNNPSNTLPDLSLEQFTTHYKPLPTMPTLQRLSNNNTMVIEPQNHIVSQQLGLKLLKEEYLPESCNNYIFHNCLVRFLQDVSSRPGLCLH